MPVLTSGKTSTLSFDGQLHCVVQSRRLAFGVGALSNQASFVAPCDLVLVEALLSVIATPTSANAKLNVGTPTDTDAFLDAYTCTNLAVGTYDISAAAEWVDKTIPAGTVIEFELEAATAVGTVAVVLVFAPGVQA